MTYCLYCPCQSTRQT